MGQYSSTDYAYLTKRGFLFGLGLLVFGIVGEFLVPQLYGTVPAWEHTLFLYSEGLGIVVGFLSVFVFGIFLPLAE